MRRLRTQCRDVTIFQTDVSSSPAKQFGSPAVNCGETRADPLAHLRVDRVVGEFLPRLVEVL